MRITYLRLENFDRFPLSNKDVFEHHFDEKMTIILGGNGHGKSSLMSELTPLPSSKDAFKRGGYKEIRITHNGSNYVLISDFRDGAKYMFLKDEVELNKSNLISVQRDLVYDHFKITPIVHEILTSQENFTTMSLVARKKLLSSISRMNIDAVLNNYNTLKESLKNHQFLLKTTVSQMLAETERMNDENRVQNLIEQKDKLGQQIEALLHLRTSLYQYSGSVELETVITSYSSIKRAIDTLYSQHYCLITSHPYVGLDEYGDDLRSEIKAHEVLLSDKYSQLSALETKRKQAEAVQNSDKAQLQIQIAEATATYNLVCSRLRYLSPDLERVDAAIANYETIQHALPDLVTHMPANPDGKLSSQALDQAREERARYMEEQVKTVRSLSTVESELKELKQHKRQQCPKCEHVWLPETVDKRIVGLTTQHADLLERQAMLQKLILDLTGEVDRQTAYAGQTLSVRELLAYTLTNTQEFWKKVSAEKLLSVDPLRLSSLIEEFCSEVRVVKSLQTMRAEIEKRRVEVETLDSLGNTTLERLRTEYMETETEVIMLQNQLRDYRSELKDVTLAKQLYERFNDLYSALDRSKSDVQTHSLRHAVNAAMTEIDSQLSILKVSVIEIQKELAKTEASKAVIESLKRKSEDAQESIKVLEIMLAELSPKNGFIAKTISNFLNVIITSINAVIRENWSYKMELRTINVDEDALNYRFKVVVEDRHVIDDISKVSGGMQEIVNLAMKFTLMMLLKLQGYPMYLDEFGVKLDNRHKAKIASIIFQMLDSPMYSQIFLITHMDVAYSDFKNTEVIEL